MPKADKITLSVPSRLDYLDMVQEMAERLSGLVGLDSEVRLDFGLAVREGAINAMKHAHGFDPLLPVRITFTVTETELEVRVRDVGEGFDPEATPDPTSPENILRASGRGLLLIGSLVDSIEFIRHDKGMELILVRQLPRPEAAGGETP